MEEEKREKHDAKMIARGQEPQKESESKADYLYRMCDPISNITHDNDREKQHKHI